MAEVADSEPLLSEYSYELEVQSKTQQPSATDSRDSHDLNSRCEKCHTSGNAKAWAKVLKAVQIATPYVLAALPGYLKINGLDIGKELHPTSYLDALRGYAAWIVLNYHRFALRDIVFLQYPFIRLINSGKGMVDLFFVISGFVLTQGMLKSMRAQQKVKLFDTLASSIFRRYIRLYVPCLLVSFVAMVAFSLGWANLPPPRQSNFFAQLWHWTKDFAQFCNPFANISGWYDDTPKNAYIGPLWTIPVEFRGSVIVYVWCAGTAKLRSKHRLFLCTMVIFLAFAWQATYASLFLSGVWIAEYSLIQHPERYQTRIALPENSSPGPSQTTSRARSIGIKVLCICLLTISMFLLGAPRRVKETPFLWTQLDRWIPSYYHPGLRGHFWTSIASPMFIWAVDSWSLLQRPFCWRFSQYIGKLSFGIYVLHSLVISSFYENVLDKWAKSHHNSWWSLMIIVVVNWLVIFWLADYFDRIDRRIVQLGKWLQTRYFMTW